MDTDLGLCLSFPALYIAGNGNTGVHEVSYTYRQIFRFLAPRRTLPSGQFLVVSMRGACWYVLVVGFAWERSVIGPAMAGSLQQHKGSPGLASRLWQPWCHCRCIFREGSSCYALLTLPSSKLLQLLSENLTCP